MQQWGRQQSAAEPGQPWDTLRAAGAAADRAAFAAGYLHPISVTDTETGTPTGTCLWDLTGGFLSGMWVWVAEVAEVQVQLEHPVMHSNAQEKGRELLTYIPIHPFSRCGGSTRGWHCNILGLCGRIKICKWLLAFCKHLVSVIILLTLILNA